jgi:predicted lipoprotein with Yx(FWY)xxD motif
MLSAATIAAGAGFALAVAVAPGASGSASKPYTLNVDAAGAVGATHEAILVARGKAPVYELTGESVHHFLCTTANGCIALWPIVPVTGKGTVTAAPGVRGKLGFVRRRLAGRSVRQATLGGHPLYRFVQDTQPGVATGNGIVHFGGTWHVFLATGKPAPAGGAPQPGTTPTNTTTTPTYTYTTPTYTQPTTSTYTYTYP